MNLWMAAAAGLAAGALHVVSGPDHLAAIGALSADRSRPGHLGFRWGSGHALGVLLVGLAAMGLRSFADLAPLERWGEVVVGAALVVAGVRALRAKAHPPAGRWAVAFGTLHGVAGASHLWGTLPALALPANGPAQAYLAAFCAGSVAAMTLFSAALGWARARTSSERPWALAAGTASILVGIGWAAYSFA